MDKFELRAIMLTGIALAVFFVAILISRRLEVQDLPACIPYGQVYKEAKVENLGDSLYQVFMIAQMWNFEPTEVFLPVGAEVEIFLTSQDVVHGFHIADKNVNMMAVFGGINKMTVKFNEPGVYPVYCHEYCGAGHQHMKSEFIVNYPNQ